MVDLAAAGMHEVNGMLIQDFGNGKAMQVRLGTDRVEVHCRQVPAERMNDTDATEPSWRTAYGYILAEWRTDNSTVWRWLLEKGLEEVASAAKQLRLKPSI